MESLSKNCIKYIFIDLIGDIFYFPIWWYSKGIKKVLVFCLAQIKEGEEYLGLFIWIKNIFTPMYAQYDWQGRIISFFIRIIQIIFRAVFLFIWIILCFSLLLIWTLIPIFVIWQIYRNILIIQ